MGGIAIPITFAHHGIRWFSVAQAQNSWATGLHQTQGMLPLITLLACADSRAETDDTAIHFALHVGEKPAGSPPRSGLVLAMSTICS